MLLVLAAVLFSVSLAATAEMTPAGYQRSLLIGLTLIAMWSAISLGKKTAYLLHDRKLMEERMEMKGSGALVHPMTSIPILFGTTILLGWTVFMLVLGLIWRGVMDELMFETVRWITIGAMLFLLLGAHLVYTSHASRKNVMLSFWGKKMERPSRTLERIGNQVDMAEEHGRLFIQSTTKAAGGGTGPMKDLLGER